MKRYNKKSSKQKFDAIIIGGGITGAAIAYEAASRGLSVALFEKGDFSQATSAASSKLIHGGLRYLSNMEYKLVRESLRERRTLENIAPNFVYPLPFLFPHYRASFKSNKWIIKTGLTMYDLLSLDRGKTWDKAKKIPAHRTVSPEEATRLQPIIKRRGLTGASMFHDCISIFPERLALSFIKSAVRHEARVANYTKVTGFLFDSKKTVQGVVVRDLLKNEEYEVKGDIVINCAGPWADQMLDVARKKEKTARLRRSEGIHIITKKITNEDSILSAITPGGRHCFLIPWRGHTLIGTTDKEYLGDPDDYRVTAKSIRELIDEVNGSFEDINITFKDVLHCYGGLRPLVEDGTEETYKSSRKYEITDNAEDGLEGLLTVEGGKWTTSRLLGEKVVNLLWKKTNKPIGKSISHRKYLWGSEIRDMNAFMATVKDENKDFDNNTLEYLAKNYGTEQSKVLDLARENRLTQKVSHDGEITAQAAYAARHEMARTLLDIVLRRTGIGTLGNPGESILRTVAATAATELNWDKEKIDHEVKSVINFLKIPRE